MKRRRITVISLLLILAMTMTSFAAGSITKKEALKKALKSAKTTKSAVKHLDIELEKGAYEIEFTKRSNGNEYEFKIAKSNGRILEKSVDYTYKKPTSSKKVGKTKARKTAAKKAGVKYSKIKNCYCDYDVDDDTGIASYDVEFRSGHYKYDIEVLAATGKVIEYDKKYVK